MGLTPFRRMRHELESLFEPFFARWPAPLAEMWEFERPWGFEMEERECEVVVRAELPGFTTEEVAVRLVGNMLTIEAEHKEKEAVEAKKEVKGEKEEPKKETRFAKVTRKVTLPAGTELEKIEAFYRNGVLEVHVPKTPEAMGRRIEVKT
jgi:HSP20 family protein